MSFAEGIVSESEETHKQANKLNSFLWLYFWKVLTEHFFIFEKHQPMKIKITIF